MARARPNPYGYPVRKARGDEPGMPVGRGISVATVGEGTRTHIVGKDGGHLCRSGINAGKAGGSGASPQLYTSSANFITCGRCSKLASVNERAGRRADEKQ
jgi:hypothetical protein